MEKSIKRVEKLVHATNSALAQMKFSLMFDDDVNGGGGVDGKFRNAKAFDSAAALGESFFDGDDLKQCQSEFNTEANEVLAKLESTYASVDAARKNAKVVDRIKEINRKMNSLRLEQSRREETEQSRQKLLNLISEEKFSPGLTSSGESVQSRAVVNREKSSSSQQPPPPRRTASLLTVTRSPSGRSKEELKSKILETQEIVNRGFQTARQLAQKVETMSKSEKKEKTPSTGKTVSEINLKSLEGKTESNETVSRRRGREEEAEKKKKRKECESVERANARLIDVRRKETEGGRPNLRMQRLPSLHIKGGLQLQKVHSLEIPAAGGGGADAAFPKANTAVSFLSHEQVENEKMGDAIERVRRENCCCGGGDPRPGNYVECFNCGKLIRIRETRVDPQKVDEILQKCNYDVFDPRIDEFVERCAGEIRGRKTQQQDTVSVNAGTVTEPEITRKATSRKKKERRRSSTTLRRLSDQLLRRYKEETENIENNHMQLDNILQHLFRQVDESREVFEKCHLFRDRKPEFGQMPLLAATKPVLVSLEGVSSVGDARRSEKSEKQQVPKNRFQGEGRKNQVEKSEPRKASVIHVSPAGSGKSERRETPGKLNLSSSGHTISEIEKLEDGRSSASSSSTGWSSRRARNVLGTVEDTRVEHRRQKKKTGKPRKPATQPEPREVEEEEAHSDTVSSASSRRSNRTNEKTNPVASRREETERRTVGTPSSKSEGKGESSSENNYESDFESVTNEPNECVAECEEEEPEGNLGINKLSTISEVDSELERKLSDDQKTGRSTRTDETLPPPEDTKEEEEEEVGGDEYLPPPNLGTRAEGERVEVASPKTADTSVKSTPTELVTTLKDILSALQDQFVRTESLAEKLTESVRPEGGAMPGGVLGAWEKPIGAEMMENLRSARKDPAGGGQECPSESKKSAEENAAISADSLSDEGGSSLGEIVVSDRRRRKKKAEKSESSSISECSYLRVDSGGRRSSRVPSARKDISSGSPFKLDVNVQEGILYSEGEIPSDELSGFEQLRTGSVGEGLVAGRRGFSPSRTTRHDTT